MYKLNPLLLKSRAGHGVIVMVEDIVVVKGGAEGSTILLRDDRMVEVRETVEEIHSRLRVILSGGEDE